MKDTALDRPWWMLRLTFGLVPIVAGIDKFTNLLTDWTKYLSPLATDVVPVSPSTFMHGVGIIEIAAGALVLVPRTTRVGAYVVSGWLAAIGVSLLASGMYFDIAVRDIVMAICAFTLARLTEIRAAATDEPIAHRPRSTRERAREGTPAHAAM